MAATKLFRERDSLLGLIGWSCTSCGTVHFPRNRVCYRCRTRDAFEPVRLSDRTGRVLSYTLDHFFPTPEPPLAAGMVEVEGCRLYLQMADVEADELRCDLPVAFTFRKIHEAGARPAYFWKSTPVREPADLERRADPEEPS